MSKEAELLSDYYNCRDCQNLAAEHWQSPVYPVSWGYFRSDVPFFFLGEAPGYTKELGPRTTPFPDDSINGNLRDTFVNAVLNETGSSSPIVQAIRRWMTSLESALGEDKRTVLGKISYTNAIKFQVKNTKKLSKELWKKWANLKICDKPQKERFVNHCIVHLKEEIEYTKPAVVICLGKTAFDAVSLVSRETSMKFEVLPTPHPSRSRYSSEQTDALSHIIARLLSQTSRAR